MDSSNKDISLKSAQGVSSKDVVVLPNCANPVDGAPFGQL